MDTALRRFMEAGGVWADLPTPRFGYTGQEFDVESGLVYMNARNYDPAAQRFISPDPAGDGTNQYAYVANDPMNRTDPLGLFGVNKNPYAGGTLLHGGASTGRVVTPSAPQSNIWNNIARFTHTGNALDGMFSGAISQASRTPQMLETASWFQNNVRGLGEFIGEQFDSAASYIRASGPSLSGATKWAAEVGFGMDVLKGWYGPGPALSTAKDAGLGSAQGILNAFNGGVDFVIDTFNMSTRYAVPGAHNFEVLTGRRLVPEIPTVDFSRDVIVTEEDWAHGPSKALGGYGLFSVGPAVATGAGKLLTSLRSASAWVSAPRTLRLPTSPAAGAAEGRLLTDAQRFGGIRQASQYLRDAGVPRAQRVEWLQSFQQGTVRFRSAGDAEFGIRYFGGEAYPSGRFLFETFPASRGSLALDPRWGNTMIGFRQWQIAPGTPIIEGRAAAQGVYPGGQLQKFILDPKTGLVAP
jgi:RHS repeat-associated protein